MKLSFYGGARVVTGANYLLEHKALKILVDCGLSQGSEYASEQNYQPFEYDPKSINYVFITHSHIDHVGRLPKLYKDGFRGKVYVTTGTADLMEVALPDNMSQLAREADEHNRRPLFEQKDLDGIMGLVKAVDYGEPIKLNDSVEAVLHDAGHVLGSAIVEIGWQGKKVFFSGDLGNPPTPLLRPTEFIHDADYVIVESAYGDRIHEDRSERKNKLAETIITTINRKGVLMIPSFALERTQELLYELNELHNGKKIPDVPVYIDSPLAIKLTAVYARHSEYFNKEARYIINSGDDVFHFPGIRMTLTPDESKRINHVPPPKVIVAGSGMSQGGRIIHHEQRYLSDPNSTIMFVGYQVDGSRGRRIQRGEKEVTIFGEKVPVRCHVVTLSGYSAHADQPALLHWIDEAKKGGKLKKVFTVQGEENSAKTLAELIRERLLVDAYAPKEGESVEL